MAEDIESEEVEPELATLVRVLRLYPRAVINDLARAINEQGELMLLGRHHGVRVVQTVACNPPCVLFFDPVSKNFYPVKNMDDANPAWELVDVIRAID